MFFCDQLTRPTSCTIVMLLIHFQVEIYPPNAGKGSGVKDRPPTPPPQQQIKVYAYDELPPKYRKRYEYAARFVRLVRSKTPKVTMYTKQAKCMLMENSPSADFEVNFYSGKTRPFIIF